MDGLEPSIRQGDRRIVEAALKALSKQFDGLLCLALLGEFGRALIHALPAWGFRFLGGRG